MRKIFISSILLILVLTACAPQSTSTSQPQTPNDTSYPNPSYPNDSYPNPSPTDSPANWTPAQQAALSALSGTLNLSVDQITLVSTETVTWPDGCLGVQRMGVMCTQSLVSGFRIVLKANGKQYDYHTNQDGSVVVLAGGESVSAGPVDNSVIKQLANNLGLNEKDITVVSSSDVEFPDSCLGVSMPDIMCSQIVTPGRIIVLEVDGVQYEYHTNANGSQTTPATLALTWKREGGFAGFCDSLTVFLSGEIYGNQCKTSDGRMKTFSTLLSATEQQQFTAWIAKYGQVDLDASDPKGVADGMTVLLSLYGNGDTQLSKDDSSALFTWAQDVFQKLYQ
jgi:hypothetical protein